MVRLGDTTSVEIEGDTLRDGSQASSSANRPSRKRPSLFSSRPEFAHAMSSWCCNLADIETGMERLRKLFADRGIR
jgi:hypothetical protein